MNSSVAHFSLFSTYNNHTKTFIEHWAQTSDMLQAGAKKSPKQQVHFLAARALLRALLFRLTQQRDWEIVTGHQGKPFVIDTKGNPGPHISISHTKGLVACAVSNLAPIGIDSEQWKERNFITLANYAFGPKEQALVKDHGIAAFYQIWTLREAIGKSTGEGLRVVTNQQDLVTSLTEEYCQRENFYLYHYKNAPKDYSISLALQHALSNPKNDIMELINIAAFL